MKFEEVLPALRKGRKITCSIIRNSGHQYIYYTDGTIFEDKGGYWHLTDKEIVEIDDWEIVPNKKKVKLRDLTQEQYVNYCRKCGTRLCSECPLSGVECNLVFDSCWFKNKDLYNDKFLDQEVEIEE